MSTRPAEASEYCGKCQMMDDINAPIAHAHARGFPAKRAIASNGRMPVDSV